MNNYARVCSICSTRVTNSIRLQSNTWANHFTGKDIHKMTPLTIKCPTWLMLLNGMLFSTNGISVSTDETLGKCQAFLMTFLGIHHLHGPIPWISQCAVIHWGVSKFQNDLEGTDGLSLVGLILSRWLKEMEFLSLPCHEAIAPGLNCISLRLGSLKFCIQIVCKAKTAISWMLHAYLFNFRHHTSWPQRQNLPWTNLDGPPMPHNDSWTYNFDLRSLGISEERRKRRQNAPSTIQWKRLHGWI